MGASRSKHGCRSSSGSPCSDSQPRWIRTQHASLTAFGARCISPLCRVPWPSCCSCPPLAAGTGWPVTVWCGRDRGFFLFSFSYLFSGDVSEYSVHLDASVCWFSAKRPIQDGIETVAGCCACCSGNGSGWAGLGRALLCFDDPAQPLHDHRGIWLSPPKPDFRGR